LPAKPKDSYHHGDLRTELLAQAPEMISDQGLEKFTLRALARQIGVTHGAVYRHFSDKRELLVALALTGHAEFSGTLQTATSSDDDVETSVLAVAAAYLRWSLSHDSQYQIMFGPRLNEDGRHPELEAAIEKTFCAVDALFDRIPISKARRRDLSILLMTQLHGYCELVRLRRIRVRGAKAAETYLMKCIRPLVVGICAEFS
jgi:AcrR family transcriptional regulator